MPTEIIVHDDASTDGSCDYIRSHYPQVTLIESDTNVGFCIANNRMVEAAQGEYVLLLNNDAALFPDAIESFYNAVQDGGEHDLLTLPQYEMDSGQLLDRGMMLDLFMNPIPVTETRNGAVAMAMGSCLWLSRVLWQRIGGFPAWFGTLAEDMYLCCVARLWGSRVRCLDNSGYYHKVGNTLGGGKVVANRLKTSLKRRVLSERNKSYVMAIYYPSLLLWPILPLHILLLLFEGSVLSLLKRDGSFLRRIYWNAVISLWREREMLLHTRKQVQSLRRASLRQVLAVHQRMPHKLRMLINYGIPKIS
jgi:GT2 family glycosyltransferase